MKHLFYIHSGITLSLSLKIIQYKSLNLTDCIFLFSRFFPNDIPEKIKVFNLDHKFDVTKDFYVSLFFLRPLFNSIKLNRLLKKLTSNREYHAYIPLHFMNRFYLITNPKKCVGFSYVEEGSVVYLNKEELKSRFTTNKAPSLIKELLFKLCFFGKVPRDKDFFLSNNSKLENFYTLSKYGFPFEHKKKTVLSLPFKMIKSNEKIKNIFILERYLDVKLLSEKNYYLTIDKCLEFLKDQKIEQFHFKYHPSQNETEKKIFLNLLEKHSFSNQAIKIDNDQNIENLIFTFKPNIFHINSSVGIYAAIMNCKIFSLLQYVKELDPNFKSNIFPEQLLSKVTHIH